jgi:chemotaxis methyl-accepting protein methylase
MFTELLASRCSTILAVDISEVALDRAKQRCRDLPKVEFMLWDARSESLPEQFDLIVATGVLEYIYRPSTLRGACERLSRALKPGGYLLLGNTVADNAIEGSWLGKRLLRGTIINKYVASDPRYETVAASLDQCLCPFAHTLLRKRVQ